jgi:signal transduction histidine kinase
VTLAVIAVLAVVLVALGIAVQTVFVAQSERALEATLAGRAQLGRQLARAGVRPQQIVNRVSTEGVTATLETRNGQLFGTGTSPGPSARTETTRLTGPGRVDGATLTVSVDTTLVRDARVRLRRVLVVGSVLALVVSAALVTAIVRWSLRPLDEVAGLARRIAGGHRGERLRPDHTDTEIGQTAQALDDMLDALEGAEARARDAEGRSRQFLADAAHELRTPVAGVHAAAETLLHTGATLTDQERQKLEALLVREADRTARLVTDLLAVARLDAGDVSRPREASDLSVLVGQELERIRLTHPSVEIRSEGSDVVAAIDPQQVAGIIRNLVDNAVRAAGTHGRVVVSVTSGDGWACVDVLDSGPGVPEADRERIFERLVRLDAGRSGSTGGSGLGLAIARGYARAHGGDVRCLAPPAGTHGALFRLVLPG